MTFKDLAQKLRSTYMSLPSVVDTLVGGFAELNPSGVEAADVSFDKTGTSLSSDNVEDAIKEIDGYVSGYTTITGNPDYFDGSNLKSLHYSQIGQVVVGSCRITTTADKPSGQSNYLFNNLPIPVSIIAPVVDSGGIDNIIINNSGQLTSNNAVAAGTYNMSFCYITSDIES